MSDRVDPRVSTDLVPEAPGSGPKSRSRSPVAPMRPCARIVWFWHSPIRTQHPRIYEYFRRLLRRGFLNNPRLPGQSARPAQTALRMPAVRTQEPPSLRWSYLPSTEVAFDGLGLIFANSSTATILALTNRGVEAKEGRCRDERVWSP